MDAVSALAFTAPVSRPAFICHLDTPRRSEPGRPPRHGIVHRRNRSRNWGMHLVWPRHGFHGVHKCSIRHAANTVWIVNSTANSPEASTGSPREASDTKDLLYGPFREWLLQEARAACPDLGDVPLPDDFSLATSSKPGNDGQSPTKLESRCFTSQNIRRMRMTYINGGPGLQVFNSVVYPDVRQVPLCACSCRGTNNVPLSGTFLIDASTRHVPDRYNIPVLGIDFLCFGKNTIICVMDLQPLFDDADYLARFCGERLAALRAPLGDMLSPMSARFYEENKFFSPHVLILRASDPAVVQSRLLPVFKSYVDHYFNELLRDTPVDASAQGMASVTHAQARYDAYSAEHDPAIKLLKADFGEQWAERYVNEFLFPWRHAAGAMQALFVDCTHGHLTGQLTVLALMNCTQKQFALFSLLGRSIGELWPPKPLTTTLTESSLRSLLKEVLEEHVDPIAAELRDIDQRLKDNAIAIEVLQNTAGLTAQAVKDIAAKPAPAGLAGDAPPITTWADMLKQHTTSTTSAVAAQLQRQTLDLREEAELAQRSLNVIVKNFTMEEGETSEKLLRAFEREILGRMGLIGEIALAAHRLPRARGKAGPPPLLLTFKTPADKISFLRRRKRLEKTLFTLDDDLTLAQQQRRRELWPIYLQLRQTKAGQPVYWKGAAIYVGHKPWQATPPPPRPQRLQTPQLRGIQQ
eukprot:jgi/Mesvir1/25633/Mv01853-RA.1